MESIFETLRRAARASEGPLAILKDRVAKAAQNVEGRLRAAAIKAQAPRPHAQAAAPQTTWMTLVRPTWGDERTPLRRAAEPVVAIVAAAALAAMGSLALASLASFVLACLVAIAILTQIFGLSLDIDLPRPQAP